MTSQLQSLLEEWDGHAVVARHDRPTGSWFFIALHDLILGPAVGGTRMKSYGSPAEGCRDAMRLAEAMTWKWASVEMPFGGGKAVLAVPAEILAPDRSGEREELLRRYGEVLESLRGAFSTGVDLGTTPEDMALLAEETSHVKGIRRGESVDPGPFTALGVHVGIQAALEHADGSAALEDRRILVQGLGDVGLPLARGLARGGAYVLCSDLDHDRAASVAEELGGEPVSPEAIPDTGCDAYAPCAVGGVLNAETIPRLRCRIVAGSANDQLDTPEDARRLHERGILYAPDFVINAGGAIAFGRMHLGAESEAPPDDEALREEVRTIGSMLRRVFAEAEENRESPLEAARRRAARVLERARGGETSMA